MNQRKQEYFLLSPLLGVRGYDFNDLMDSAETLTALGNPNVKVPEGSLQVVYDVNKQPYAVFIGNDVVTARETSQNLGLILGTKKRGFPQAEGIKGLAEMLGFYD